jgi:hypothetical protein
VEVVALVNGFLVCVGVGGGRGQGMDDATELREGRGAGFRGKGGDPVTIAEMAATTMGRRGAAAGGMRGGCASGRTIPIVDAYIRHLSSSRDFEEYWPKKLNPQ